MRPVQRSKRRVDTPWGRVRPDRGGGVPAVSRGPRASRTLAANWQPAASRHETASQSWRPVPGIGGRRRRAPLRGRRRRRPATAMASAATRRPATARRTRHGGPAGQPFVRGTAPRRPAQLPAALDRPAPRTPRLTRARRPFSANVQEIFSKRALEGSVPGVIR